jgi:tetratricopeptide (TPR) repeat protein
VSEGAASTDESSDSSTGALALKIARAMEQRGDLPGAKEAYRFAFSLLYSDDRTAGEAALGQGRVAERLGDLSQARDAFQKAAEIAPDAAVAGAAWLGLAGVAEGAGDLRQARDAFRRAAEIAPDATVAGAAWLGLAGVAERLGALRQARDAFLEAVEVAPDAAVAGGAWLGLAGVAERLGDLRQARMAYQKVIEHANPEQASLVWLSMERLRNVLEKMGYPSGSSVMEEHLKATGLASSRSSHNATQDADRLHLAAANLNMLAHQSLLVPRQADREEPDRSRRPWFAFTVRRDAADANSLYKAARDAVRHHGTFVVDANAARTMDWLALEGDQSAITEDLRIAVTEMLAAGHPGLVTTVLVLLIARKSRFDVQSAAKLQGVIHLDNEAMHHLADDLLRRHESHTTDDSSSGDL